jgi:hypothetical protein
MFKSATGAPVFYEQLQEVVVERPHDTQQPEQKQPSYGLLIWVLSSLFMLGKKDTSFTSAEASV